MKGSFVCVTDAGTALLYDSLMRTANEANCIFTINSMYSVWVSCETNRHADAHDCLVPAVVVAAAPYVSLLPGAPENE
jgi:hypothetical protein